MNAKAYLHWLQQKITVRSMYGPLDRAPDEQFALQMYIT